VTAPQPVAGAQRRETGKKESEMKCKCGAVEYQPEWCVLPGGAPLPLGESPTCQQCGTGGRAGIGATEQYERFGATLPVVRPSAGESRYAMRERWRA
jgi:hypothetical protein